MHYDLTLWALTLWAYLDSFDFVLLTLTVFRILRNSMREKFKIHSVETVSEVSHESSVKTATYVFKTKNVIKR